VTAPNDKPAGDRGPDEKSPVDQAADLFVYAPIGLFFEGPSLLPKLAEQGRVHVRNARLFGQFAVQHGEAELRRRLAAVEGPATGLLRAVGLLPPTGNGQSPATRPAADGGAAPAGEADTSAESTLDAADLAITDYDSLSATQVVQRLPGLTADELEAVRAYEAAHRRRKTILNKAAQLLA
jgi:hypothetical protein